MFMQPAQIKMPIYHGMTNIDFIPRPKPGQASRLYPGPEDVTLLKQELTASPFHWQ